MDGYALILHMHSVGCVLVLAAKMHVNTNMFIILCAVATCWMICIVIAFERNVTPNRIRCTIIPLTALTRHLKEDQQITRNTCQ